MMLGVAVGVRLDGKDISGWKKDSLALSFERTGLKILTIMEEIVNSRSAAHKVPKFWT